MQWSPPPRPPLTPQMRPITEGVVHENPRSYQDVIAGRLDPSSPEYEAQMQPPEPDGAPATPPQPGYAPATDGSPPTRRVVISFGPTPGQLMVAVEDAPDWDVAEGHTWLIPQDHLRSMLPILQVLGRVKDMTGGAWKLQLLTGGDIHGA